MTCCDNPAGYSPDRVRSSRKGGGGEAHEKIIYFFIQKDDGTRRQRQRDNNNNKSARACVHRRISYIYAPVVVAVVVDEHKLRVVPIRTHILTHTSEPAYTYRCGVKRV